MIKMSFTPEFLQWVALQMREPELECDSCGWQGDSTMLVDAPDDRGHFVYCPDCGSSEIVDYEEEDDTQW